MEALTPVDVLRRAGLPVKTVSVTGVPVSYTHLIDIMNEPEAPAPDVSEPETVPPVETKEEIITQTEEETVAVPKKMCIRDRYRAGSGCPRCVYGTAYRPEADRCRSFPVRRNRGCHPAECGFTDFRERAVGSRSERTGGI